MKRIIIPLNASSLKTTHCPLKYKKTVVDGLRSNNEREELTFGTAVHRAAELRARGRSLPQIVQELTMSYTGTQLELLIKVIMKMSDVPPAYLLKGQPMVEHEFRYDWQELIINDVMYVIRVCGTLDHVEMRSDGYAVFTDWKTTSKWKQADVFDDYRHSVQMRFYLWACRRFSYHFGLPGELAEACACNRMFLRIGGVFKSGEPRWVVGPPIRFDEDQFDEFERGLNQILRTVILPAWMFSEPPEPLGMVNETCNVNYGCDFKPLCHAATPTLMAQLLQMNYHTTDYATKYRS